MSREAMKLALEALEAAQDNFPDHGDNCFLHDEGEYNRCFCGKDGLLRHLQSVAEKLEQALEQPEPEPVAWRTFDGEGGYDYRDYDMNENYHKEWAERNPNHAHWVELLYTSPPKREPLTDEEIGAEVEKELTHYWNGEYIDTTGARDQLTAFARAIEAKLKEKNT